MTLHLKPGRSRHVSAGAQLLSCNGAVRFEFVPLGAGDWNKYEVPAAYMQGIELVQQLQSDDVIVSSRLLTGAERLVRPAVPGPPEGL